MGLYIYTIEECGEWDKIVRSFRDYDVYWLSGYVKAFWYHGDGEPLLFYYEDEDVKGINVVMKRDIAQDDHFKNKIPFDSFYDLSSPYGYGGWIIEGDKDEPLFSEYSNWCKENHIVSEFVRFHPVVKNHVMCNSKYEVRELGKVITMDISSPETIWNNFTSKNRNVIRKAIKNGVKIYNGRYPEIFTEFKAIYDCTMDKDEADEYYYFKNNFYLSVLNDLPYNSEVFYAVYDGKIIAASIMLMANGRINYHLSGSLREYSFLAPTNLLLYHTALWGCANGYKTLYLGGGVGSQEDSLFKFKKAFYRNDDLDSFHIGSIIFNKEEYKKLLGMRNEKEERNFFPQYRA